MRCSSFNVSIVPKAFDSIVCSYFLIHDFVVWLSTYKINEINENSHSNGRSKLKHCILQGRNHYFVNSSADLKLFL